MTDAAPRRYRPRFSEARERYGGGDAVARTSDILVHPRASPVLDRQSAGLGVLRIHRGQTHGTAAAGEARHSIRSALDPAGQACAVLVWAVETPALHRRGNHSYFTFCRFYCFGDSHRL